VKTIKAPTLPSTATSPPREASLLALSKDAHHPRPRPRIETLSDLIFGLALSIGALSLLGKMPSTSLEIRNDILGFAFSFLILISVWVSYSNIMSVHPMETRRAFILNVIMLFLVAIEPYLFYLVSSFDHVIKNDLLDHASTFYALDMAGLMAILAFFTHELTIVKKQLVSPELVGNYKRGRNSLLISAALFTVTAIPQFWSWEILKTPLRFYLWSVPLAVFWIRRAFERVEKHIPSIHNAPTQKTP
jgi:uncharacterized membrane protein